MAFAFYSSFCKCAKRGRKINNKKKLSQFLKSHISGTLEAISLKFGMWSAEVGGRVHSKNRLVSSRQHKATEVRKLRFLPSCHILTGVARRLLGPHDTLPCVLMLANLIKTPVQHNHVPNFPAIICQLIHYYISVMLFLLLLLLTKIVYTQDQTTSVHLMNMVCCITS